MTSDPDIEVVRAAYAAFARGDIDAAVRDLADDVEWIEPEEFPDGGVHRGRDAVHGYLSRSRAMWQHLDSVATVFRSGARIVAHHHVHGTLADGSAREATMADVFTFAAGRVVHMQAYANPDLVPDG
jgi:ketosteroid isomerase-like protein